MGPITGFSGAPCSWTRSWSRNRDFSFCWAKRPSRILEGKFIESGTIPAVVSNQLEYPFDYIKPRLIVTSLVTSWLPLPTPDSLMGQFDGKAGRLNFRTRWSFTQLGPLRLSRKIATVWASPVSISCYFWLSLVRDTGDREYFRPDLEAVWFVRWGEIHM